MTPPQPIRVLAAVGPGDVVMAYEDWKSGASTLSETSIPFSILEFEALESRGIAYWAVSMHPRRAVVERGGNRVENRPRSEGPPAGGWRYHVQLLRYAVSLLGSARRFGATHAVVDTGTTHWFALALFRLFGIEVVPNFHNVYWPQGYPPRGMVKRMVLALDGWFFRLGVRTAMGCSAECGHQVAQISGGRTRFCEYRAQFLPGDFEALPPPRWSRPLRVLFAGRVEVNKGALDLVSIAQQLEREHPAAFVFDVCGAGGADEALARRVAEHRLEGSIVLHGKLRRPELLAVYGRSHVVIVPTRSDFCEGLPMVSAEAVLARRPVVTSRLSNALEALSGAVLETQPDDPASYAAQLARLLQDPALYESLVQGTAGVGRQFTDPRRGVGMALLECLRPPGREGA